MDENPADVRYAWSIEATKLKLSVERLNKLDVLEGKWLVVWGNDSCHFRNAAHNIYEYGHNLSSGITFVVQEFKTSFDAMWKTATSEEAKTATMKMINGDIEMLASIIRCVEMDMEAGINIIKQGDLPLHQIMIEKTTRTTSHIVSLKKCTARLIRRMMDRPEVPGEDFQDCLHRMELVVGTLGRQGTQIQEDIKLLDLHTQKLKLALCAGEQRLKMLLQEIKTKEQAHMITEELLVKAREQIVPPPDIVSIKAKAYKDATELHLCQLQAKNLVHESEAVRKSLESSDESMVELKKMLITAQERLIRNRNILDRVKIFLEDLDQSEIAAQLSILKLNRLIIDQPPANRDCLTVAGRTLSIQAFQRIAQSSGSAAIMVRSLTLEIMTAEEFRIYRFGHCTLPPTVLCALQVLLTLVRLELSLSRSSSPIIQMILATKFREDAMTEGAILEAVRHLPLQNMKCFQPPRRLIIPEQLNREFLKGAEGHSVFNIETCGYMFGTEEGEELKVSHLYIPPQTATFNRCCASSESLIKFGLERNLLRMGSIHVHPIPDLTLSSLDLHAQAWGQMQIKEYVGFVCSPTILEPKIYFLNEKGLEEMICCKVEDTSTSSHLHSNEDIILELPPQHVVMIRGELAIVNELV